MAIWSHPENNELSATLHDPQTGWRANCRVDRPELGVDFAPPGQGWDRISPLRVCPPRDTVEPGLFDHLSQRVFPPLIESYFRGTDCVALMPQDATSEFGVTVSYRLVTSSHERMILETVVAVQTNLLDSHPTIDVISELPSVAEPAQPPLSIARHAVTTDAAVLRDTTPPAILRLPLPGQPAAGQAILMLPPSDRAAARALEPLHSYPHLRMLAEFLEKGVIRKARFWTARWITVPTTDQLTDDYQSLLAEPLPLSQ